MTAKQQIATAQYLLSRAQSQFIRQRLNTMVDPDCRALSNLVQTARNLDVDSGLRIKDKRDKTLGQLTEDDRRDAEQYGSRARF